MGSHLFWEGKLPSDRVVAIPFFTPSDFYIIPKCHFYPQSGASRNPGFPSILGSELCKGGVSSENEPFYLCLINQFYFWNSTFRKGELS